MESSVMLGSIPFFVYTTAFRRLVVPYVAKKAWLHFCSHALVMIMK